MLIFGQNILFSMTIPLMQIVWLCLNNSSFRFIVSDLYLGLCFTLLTFLIPYNTSGAPRASILPVWHGEWIH